MSIFTKLFKPKIKPRQLVFDNLSLIKYDGAAYNIFMGQYEDQIYWDIEIIFFFKDKKPEYEKGYANILILPLDFGCKFDSPDTAFFYIQKNLGQMFKNTNQMVTVQDINKKIIHGYTIQFIDRVAPLKEPEEKIPEPNVDGPWRLQ